MHDWKKKLKELTSKKIALLGLGLDNRALLELLERYGNPDSVTICDFRPQSQLAIPKLKRLKLNYQLEDKFNRDLYKFDILFRSPGWPLACPGVQEARRRGLTDINSPLNLFLSVCPSQKIIGVTGSKGKGTTASLINEILKKSGRKVWLGGNIGIAPLSFLPKIKATDWVVLELSSFQLEDARRSPRFAVLTNIFHEHLSPADPNNPNFHSSFSAYWEAKLNIACQPGNRYLIANQKLKPQIKTAQLKSQIIYFAPSHRPSGLIGNFNQENVGAAEAIAKLLKIPAKQFGPVIKGFHNLNHRLEKIPSRDGRDYFDNSFSTTPESTILDLESFRQQPIILIVGGADKGADFSNLAKTIKQKVKFLVLLTGAGTERIKKELKKVNFPPTHAAEANSMEKAVSLAKKKSKAGDVILLSTACASFGLFKNYKERGDLFKKYVEENQN